MIIYTKGTVKIVENPSVVEKFQLTEESAIEGFYCTVFESHKIKNLEKSIFRYLNMPKGFEILWKEDEYQSAQCR